MLVGCQAAGLALAARVAAALLFAVKSAVPYSAGVAMYSYFEGTGNERW